LTDRTGKINDTSWLEDMVNTVSFVDLFSNFYMRKKSYSFVD